MITPAEMIAIRAPTDLLGNARGSVVLGSRPRRASPMWAVPYSASVCVAAAGSIPRPAEASRASTKEPRLVASGENA